MSGASCRTCNTCPNKNSMIGRLDGKGHGLSQLQDFGPVLHLATGTRANHEIAATRHAGTHPTSIISSQSILCQLHGIGGGKVACMWLFCLLATTTRDFDLSSGRYLGMFCGEPLRSSDLQDDDLMFILLCTNAQLAPNWQLLPPAC
jgi:hypothetical protein